MKDLLIFLKNSWRISLWLVIGGCVMSYFIWIDCCEGVSSLVWICVFTSTIWLVLWLGNAYLSEFLNRFISWHQQPVKRLLVGLLAMVVYTLGAVFTIIMLFQAAGFTLGDRQGNTFVSTTVITLIITMFMTGRAFLLNWRQSAVDAEKLKRESVKAQFESLRNQVNPHFLFNSLNALTNLVHQDPDQAVKFIKQLSEVYRYVLDTREKELVPLAEEMKFLDSYFFLQKIRFGDKLKLQNSVQDIAGNVAPLALQMLVENAIKHNVISDEQPLTIKIHVHNGSVVVENNLQRKSVIQEPSSGVGLENIKKRYQFLSDKPVMIKDGSVSFAVALPLIPAS